MTFKSIKQEQNTRQEQKDKILEILIIVMGISGLRQIDIARKLGYSKDVFSQIKTGFSIGSPQLLAGLELLKELTVLKQAGDAPQTDLQRELEQMKQRLREIETELTRSGPGGLAGNEVSSTAGAAAVKTSEMLVEEAKKKNRLPPKQ